MKIYLTHSPSISLCEYLTLRYKQQQQQQQQIPFLDLLAELWRVIDTSSECGGSNRASKKEVSNFH